jgi:hypothetical protein
MGCHAREHGKIMPDSDWELSYEDDLGGLEGTCDKCGTELRYVFYIWHKLWGSLAVGTNCCDKLTGTTDASEYTNKRITTQKRCNNFVRSKKWEGDAKNISISYCGFYFWIRLTESGYQLVVNGYE